MVQHHGLYFLGSISLQLVYYLKFIDIHLIVKVDTAGIASMLSQLHGRLGYWFPCCWSLSSFGVHRRVNVAVVRNVI